MTRRSHGKKAEEKPAEPLILWWMPVVALLAPLVYAAWQAASADSDALTSALQAMLWPGAALYLGAVALLWGGWKIELE